MKTEVSLEKLRGAALTASRFVARSANLPILRTVLVSAHGGSVTLRATNLECGVEVSVPAKVEVEGVCAVPGDVFGGFLQNSSGRSVVLEGDGASLSMSTTNASAKLRTLPSDEFPTLPRVSGEKSFSVRGKDLSDCIHSVAFCAAVSGVKPELQSVVLHGEGGKLYGVATDSFRLAERAYAVRTVSSLQNILIPLRNAAELSRLLADVGEDVVVYYNENQLALQVGDLYYTTRLIDGTFPNYRSIIPKEYGSEAVVLREDLSQSLKLLAIFADKFAQVLVSVSPKDKTLTLTSKNSELGENTTTLRATVSGEPISMTFNGRYLADSLLGVSGESMKFSFSGVGKPLLITPATDQSFLYIVMPMNR